IQQHVCGVRAWPHGIVGGTIHAQSALSDGLFPPVGIGLRPCLFRGGTYDSKVFKLHRFLTRRGRVLAGGFFLVALAATAEEPRWLTRPWLSDDGLPNNTVTGIAQTPDNYLWVATANGLARFDGLRFEEFASSSFISPPDRGLLAMTSSKR